MKKLKWVMLFTCLAYMPSAWAMDVHMSSEVPYAKNAVVRNAVKQQCELTTKLPHFIQVYGKKYGINVELDIEGVNTHKGRVLLVEITNVHANGGGAFSGAKSVSVKGKLLKNGKVVATFTGSRYSTGGLFAGFKGTCSIAGRCVKSLGADIAKWLKNPVSGAMLGDQG